MKRFLMYGFILTLHLTFLSMGVSADVSSEELRSYTLQTGLTEEELSEYLSVYDLSFKDFNSVNELASYLGEPVTEDTINTLLVKHNMDEDDLQNILGGFGESIRDYLFIKDLETTVDFYFNHAEVLVEAERMLSEIGLSEDEIDSLFQHVSSLNETNLNEKMNEIGTNLEKYFSYNEGGKLTIQQQKEVLSLYNKMIKTFELQPRYYLLQDNVKQAISYEELTKKASLNGADLLVELYKSSSDDPLLDLRVTEDMLASDFILERGEKILTVASLANEMSIGVHGERLPDTATPYESFIFIGILFIIIGAYLLYYPKKSRV